MTAMPEADTGFVPYVVGAREIPDIRAALVESQRGTDQDQLAADLERAELFHVSSDFCQLLAAAVDTMPSHPLTRFDLPSPTGVAIVASPRHTADRSERRYFGDEAGWFWAETPGCLLIAVIKDARECKHEHRVSQRYCLGSSWQYSWGDAFDAAPRMTEAQWSELNAYITDRSDVPPDRESIEQAWSVMSPGTLRFASNLIVFWNLLRQSAVAEQSQVHAPRAVQRRIRRAGYEPAPIRIVSLRGSSGRSGADDTGRQWNHRWVVRGHWRQQWYPSIEDHRPVWIAPHLKGPEDAPLLGGQKVYAVKAPPEVAS